LEPAPGWRLVPQQQRLSPPRMYLHQYQRDPVRVLRRRSKEQSIKWARLTDAVPVALKPLARHLEIGSGTINLQVP
jgi:hypothetical protein